MLKRKILLFISLILLGMGLYFVFQFYQIFFWSNTAFKNEFSYVFIDSDDTIDSLAYQLQPILKRTNQFLIAAEKKGYSQNIKSGKYKITKDDSNNTIINLFRSKKLTVKVIFNNQERLENLAGRVSRQIAPDSLTLLNTFRDSLFLLKNGFSKENALTMYLPNSYQFYWDTSAEKFRNKMFLSFNNFWNTSRLRKAKAIKLNPNEVVVLASIVQKESVKKDEQPRIAGVYLNRLDKKMKLQADPTVIYAFKKNSYNFDQIIKRVLYKDLKLISPYNTYRVKGLPPGPITMPDISVIDAVLNAEKHSFLYFVASPNKPGYHLFAKNLVKHNQNKKIYTRWLDKQNLYR